MTKVASTGVRDTDLAGIYVSTVVTGCSFRTTNQGSTAPMEPKTKAAPAMRRRRPTIISFFIIGISFFAKFYVRLLFKGVAQFNLTKS